MDEHLDRPLCEIGYAIVPIEHVEQHSKHTSSNYLMNLTDAICKVKFGKYRIAQYIVLHTVHLTHAMYAEIIASRIGLAYTAVGGGWCHFMAGVSHQGAETVGDKYYSTMQERLMKDLAFLCEAACALAELESRVNFAPHSN